MPDALLQTITAPAITPAATLDPNGVRVAPDARRRLTPLEREALRELRRRFAAAAEDIASALATDSLDRAFDTLGAVESTTGGLAIACAARLGRG
jgi:hypothetical protein